MTAFAFVMQTKDNILMVGAALPTRIMDAQQVPSTRATDGVTTATEAALSALITPVCAWAANTAPTRLMARNAHVTTLMMVASASSQLHAVKDSM